MSGRSSRGVRGMKLEGGDKVVSAFEVPDISLSAELCDEVEKGWTGKAPKKDLSAEAVALLESPEIVQIASTGHIKRTTLHAYRQTRRDNRGINDRGPAKTIGDFVAFALAQAGQEKIGVREEIGVTYLAVEGLRKAGRATTGAISAEGAKGVF
jgi:DNA gyrase/topoisomerase IV subunit A